MFVDLMHDIHTTFTERFLRAQLVFGPPNAPPSGDDGASARGPSGAPPRRRYNALGILEDVPVEEPASANGRDGDGDGQPPVMDIAPDEPPKQTVKARQDPLVVGAGRARPLSQMGGAKRGTAGAPTGEIDWTSVGRNDPCPCGSGKKFKKCHGANA